MKELEPKQQRFDFEFREVSNNARESVPEETPEEKRVAKFNEIFVILFEDGKEITVPNIEHFIKKIDFDQNRIFIRNYKELLEVL